MKLDVNGNRHEIDVDPEMPLLWVLREHLKLTGTKYGCGIAACGACTVHLNGEAVRSCAVPVSAAQDTKITTIEAIEKDTVGRAVQAAWIKHDVVQCGYCQSGQVMTAVALLKHNPRPSRSEVIAGMAGNLCRCGTYQRIREAVLDAAQSSDK
jgi:isoquinoline 1-oxidoreductase subunit alpha